jgi:DNA-binding transcriptional regulator/RsmH inhibitor MraZ
VEEMHARQKSQFVAFVQRSKADTEIVLVGYISNQSIWDKSAYCHLQREISLASALGSLE